jgi:hypothetical protein
MKLKPAAGIFLCTITASLAVLLLACGDDDSGDPDADQTATAGATAGSDGTPVGTVEFPEECSVAEDEIGLASRLEFEQDGEFRQGGRFPLGEPVTARMRLIGCSSGETRLYFATTQRYEMLIENDETGDRVWSSTDGESFAEEPGEELIEPGGTIEYTEVWEQVNSEGAQAGVGTYKVSFLSVGCPVESAESCRFGPVSKIEITD